MKKTIPAIQRVGQKFNKLIVLSLTEKDKNNLRKCMVQCDCGNIVETRLSGVVSGHVKTCGCSQREHIRKLGKASKIHLNSAIGSAYKDYRYGARKRGYSFELSYNEFEQISIQNCHYCNAEPKRHISTDFNDDSVFLNGIDRKDNNTGYTVENSIPCCKICNRAKNNMSYEEFMSYLRGVAIWQNNHQKD